MSVELVLECCGKFKHQSYVEEKIDELYKEDFDFVSRKDFSWTRAQNGNFVVKVTVPTIEDAALLKLLWF